MRLTSSTGIAKPMPALAPEGLKMAVFTPISRPAESSSGPPELPGLMAASVWIAPRITRRVTDSISRLSALTMPVVSVWSSPKGCRSRRPAGRPQVAAAAHRQGLSLPAGRDDLQHREIAVGKAPTSSAL